MSEQHPESEDVESIDEGPRDVPPEPVPKRAKVKTNRQAPLHQLSWVGLMLLLLCVVLIGKGIVSLPALSTAEDDLLHWQTRSTGTRFMHTPQGTFAQTYPTNQKSVKSARAKHDAARFTTYGSFIGSGIALVVGLLCFKFSKWQPKPARRSTRYGSAKRHSRERH